MNGVLRRNAGLMGTVGLLAITLIVLPLIAPQHIVLQVTLYFSYAILALSLAFVWGVGGIFSFGQAAFFGIGGYTYAIMAINMGDSTVPVIAALVVPAIAAAVLGYFMFYGRLTSVYIAVITLVMTLIIFKFMGQTAGFSYRIGNAHLGGYNGIPAIPPLNVPGDPSRFAWPEDMFYISGLALILCYVTLKLTLRTRFGRVLAGVRENELRAQLLGYDVRFYKTAAFVIGAVVAALGGVCFTNWNGFIDPNVFALGMSAQTIIWVVVGGLGTFFGPMAAAVALGFLAIELGAQQAIDANLILGVILILFVLVMPSGIVPTIQRGAEWLCDRNAKRTQTATQVGVAKENAS